MPPARLAYFRSVAAEYQWPSRDSVKGHRTGEEEKETEEREREKGKAKRNEKETGKETEANTA